MLVVEQLETANGSVQGVMAKAPGGEGHPCKRGYLMCGYLNLPAAEKFGDAAVLVGGADFDAVLANEIKGATSAAKALGVKEGMTGREAAAILNA